VSARLKRAIDLREAVAINVITMVGIGPLITIPLVLASLGGALALLGWIGGAIVALCDGLVWGELSSRFPGSGGTYIYLREAFGAQRLGGALAFLFNWQFLLYAPCILASGYIGFADYAAYLVPSLAQWWPLHATTLAVGILTTLLLLRKTSRVAATGLALGVVAVLTLALVAIAALTHAHWSNAMQIPQGTRLDAGLFAGFASALYITLYDYVGYADIALVGEEVRSPVRTIPRSILISVLVVAVLYIALQTGILGVIPWHSLFGPGGAPTAASQYVGSLAVERTWGVAAAKIVTILVLVTAFASLYGNLLGMSRIPFAAARDGAFIPAFARLHPRKEIPQTAVLAIGALSLVASFFSLGQVIAFLTAGIVLVQSVLQIAALAVLRRQGPAPFRMPLYPLPALVALVGWLLAFIYTGPQAIAVGTGWLIVGLVVFLAFARARRLWPFPIAALACAALLHPQPARANPVGAWKTWNASRVVQMNGYPVFEVDGKPFFVWGASFFYERVPRDQWRDWLRIYRQELHVNTIDLYVPWNWQEPTKGNLDFTGRTNPRRDLLGLFRIIHSMGMKVVVRPGPVIRNEWRNGGYPAWLLERPEYNMPLRDVLEGRYPATATLQNQHADAAANEWLHNATHLHYASLWLRDVLTALAPYSHDIISIALDDDQGAYPDNDTWPAPHWHAYINWLKATVHGVTGDRVPVFINTWQMKVPADSPVWAWGNWYQSSAYRIGEHDREQLDFSTGVLGTQPHLPIMISEFQAGWLQGADEGEPRPADPTNTTLALGELLADGAHGIVNFPVQDTIYPAGWEVPWANWAYDWDAAFRDDLCSVSNVSSRYYAMANFGAFVSVWNEFLAQTHRNVDAQIVWPPSLFRAGSLDNAQIARDADAAMSMIHRCRERALNCELTHLTVAPGRIKRNVPVILPIAIQSGDSVLLTRAARAKLSMLRSQGLLLRGLSGLRDRIINGGDGDASLLLSGDDAYGFLVVPNWSEAPKTAGPYRVRLAKGWISLPRTTIAGRGLRIFALAVKTHAMPDELLSPLSSCASVNAAHLFDFDHAILNAGQTTARSTITRADPFADGSGTIALHNADVLLIFAPGAGARVAAVQIPDGSEPRNFASTIGLLRDAVDPEPTPSARDYIAAATHPLPAGTFNRAYRCRVLSAHPPVARVTCSYHAPDLPAAGGTFRRTLSLADGSNEIVVHEQLAPDDNRSTAHLKSISGFAVDPGDVVLTPAGFGSCFGVYASSQRQLARLCWRAQDVLSAEIRRTRGAVIVTLHFKQNDVTMRLGILRADSLAGAKRALDAP
jgi:amino acid transporter